MNHGLVEKGMELILKGIGVSSQDRNFLDTPERYARALAEMFNPPNTEWATFNESYTDFILLRGHRMYSLCPHHMFPVKFDVSLAYIPNGAVLGLSKLARLCHDVNRGPLLQERFTNDLCHRIIDECEGAHGVAVYVRGEHACLQIRGVKSGADFVTYKFMGDFETKPHLEERFFHLVGHQNGTH